MRVPTKQIQELSDREMITPSAQRCLTWLFRKCPDYNQAFTVDLHYFNAWIGKHRKKGAYSPSSLGKIRDQVIRLPILKIKRQYSAHVFELVIESVASETDKQIETEFAFVKNRRGIRSNNALNPSLLPTHYSLLKEKRSRG